MVDGMPSIRLYIEHTFIKETFKIQDYLVFSFFWRTFLKEFTTNILQNEKIISLGKEKRIMPFMISRHNVSWLFDACVCVFVCVSKINVSRTVSVEDEE